MSANTPPNQMIPQLNAPPPLNNNQNSDSDSAWSLASENFGTPPPSESEIDSEDISADSHFSHGNMPWNPNNQEASSRPPNAMSNLIRNGRFVDLDSIQQPEPLPQNNAVLNVLQNANMISESGSENSE